MHQVLTLVLLLTGVASIRVKYDDTIPADKLGDIDEALKEADLDATCRLDIENEKLIIESPRWGTINAPEQEVGDKPILCRVISKDKPLVKLTDKTAVLSVFSTVRYMFKDEAGFKGNFLATVNKLRRSELSQRPFYIWIGEGGKVTEHLKAVQESAFCHPSAANFQEPSNHYLKPLAEYALFTHIKVPAFIYIDADAWFSDTSTSNEEMYLDIAPGTEAVFTQGRVKPHSILMNGGLHIIKNTDFGQTLVKGWWENRCGFTDQKALWRSAYNALNQSLPEFNYELPLMTGKTAGDYHLEHVIEYTKKGASFLKGQWSCKNGDCWHEGNRLKEPLQVGALLVLPAMKVPSANGPIRALIEDIVDKDDSVFICHAHSNHGAQPANPFLSWFGFGAEASQPSDSKIMSKSGKMRRAKTVGSGDEPNGCFAEKVCADGKCDP